MTNILLTGFPRIGKTTIIKRFLEKTTLNCSGFYTEEIRNERGMRVGFKVRSINDGKEGILAHVNLQSNYRVGKYFVGIKQFESVAIDSMDSPTADIIVIDEIGKMELFSEKFRKKLVECLNKGNVLATITRKGGGGFVEMLKKRHDVEIIVITEQNRDAVVYQLLEKLRKI